MTYNGTRGHYLRAAAWILLSVVLPRPGLGAEFEAPPSLRASEFLARHLLRSAHHRVREEVGISENLLKFEVESDFGLYPVLSMALLEIRVHEIDVLTDALSQYEQADRELGATLRGQLRLRSDSVVDILTSPFSSATDLAGQLSSNIYDTLAGTELPSGAPAPAAPGLPAGKDSIFEAHKRAVAHQLTLDVYSTNPRVQDFLNTVAAARASGTFSAASGLVLRPRRRRGRSVGQVDVVARSLARHLRRSDLLDAVSGELRRMEVPWAEVQSFVSNPWISPGTKMTITAYLDNLTGVKGLREIVVSAARARSEAQALAHEQFVRMLAVYHQHHRLARLLHGFPGAVARSGSVVVVLPVDLVYWSRDTKSTFDRIRQAGLDAARAPGAAAAVEVLVRGTVTDRARAELSGAGVSLRERFLSDTR